MKITIMQQLPYKSLLLSLWLSVGIVYTTMAQHKIIGCEVVTGVQSFLHPVLELGPGAAFINQGQVHYQQVVSLVNHGSFTQLSCVAVDSNIDPCADTDIATGTHVFSEAVSSTTISGSAPIQMSNVYLQRDIHLENEWQIRGALLWQQGIITTDRTSPERFIHFQQGSSMSNVDEASHVDGFAAWSGSGYFTLPTGNGQKTGLIGIQGSCGSLFKATYLTRPPLNGSSLDTGLQSVSLTEVWAVRGQDSTQLTLHFDQLSTLSVLSDDILDLVVVGWNGNQWVNLGRGSHSGDINSTGTITSLTLVPDDYQFFGFGALCQAFSPGGISSSGETICFGGQPSTIGSVSDATGGDGQITYRWRSSLDTFAQDIPGAQEATYTPPAGLELTVSYIRYANDGACSSIPMPSAGTWTVQVLPEPELTCPSDIQVMTSHDGLDDCFGEAQWIHPVETAVACAPFILTAQLAEETTLTVTPGTAVSLPLSPGVYPVLYKLRDAADNLATCYFTITVLDDEAPVLDCQPSLEIDLNGADNYSLDLNELATVYDNCSQVQTVFYPTVISSAQLGQAVPVQVNAVDDSGNYSSCTVMVRTGGLPPGWRQQSGILGDCVTDVVYDINSGQWTGSATSCVYGSPFQQDALMFAHYTLCGDGSITAELTGLSGGQAFAGIMMREFMSADAKKVQLMINRTSNIARREIRFSQGGQAFPSYFSNPVNRTWLRIVRTGNTFRAFTSHDGQSWWFVMQVFVPMNNCIEMGLVLTNLISGQLSTATFSNVTVVGGSGDTQHGPNRSFELTTEKQGVDFSVFPNPASTELQLQLLAAEPDQGYFSLHNMQGLEMCRTDISRPMMSVDKLPPGIYFVRLNASGFPALMKKIIITR
jgi:hypothetical protein